MKAFLVNRVGDFGFILGIGLIVAYAGTLNYTEVFAKAGELGAISFPWYILGQEAMLITVICNLPVHRCHGQVCPVSPLHVWFARFDGKVRPRSRP